MEIISGRADTQIKTPVAKRSKNIKKLYSLTYEPIPKFYSQIYLDLSKTLQKATRAGTARVAFCFH